MNTIIAKHTPGPWIVGDRDINDGTLGVTIGGAGWRSHIAYASPQPNYADNQEANARLIAAAPELLDLIKRLNYAFYVDGTSKAMRAIMVETKPLIAKAEGR